MELNELLEIARIRAAQLPRPRTAEQAVCTLMGLGAFAGPEGHALRRLLSEIGEERAPLRITAADLASVGPLAASSLDVVVAALLDGALAYEQLRTKLKPLLVNIVH